MLDSLTPVEHITKGKADVRFLNALFSDKVEKPISRCKIDVSKPAEVKVGDVSYKSIVS
jgi:hypothetical protein